MSKPGPAQDGQEPLPWVILGLGALPATNWVIGQVAAVLGRGHLLRASLSDALIALLGMPKHLGDPRQAWPASAAAQLPGPVVYWLATALVLGAVAAGSAAVVARLGRRRHEPVDRRRRLGVEAQARLATTRDLRPVLATGAQPDRFLLGRWGRRLLCTEAAVHRGRRGVRGAVAVFGPSQSGKTTGLVAGVQAWQGPAIVSSVKADLLRATVEQRRRLGEVKVFDPPGVTGVPSARWSPLRAATTLAGAQAAAQILARADGEDSTNDRFWRTQAQQLLAAMLWVAANTEGHTMRHVVQWVLNLDRPSSDDRGTLAPLVRLLTDSDDQAVALAAKQVQGWLHGQWKTDDRTTSSVYATARNAVWPWADPQVAATAVSCDLTLDWLLAGSNTLYLCAPLGDETRVGLVFSTLLHDLISQAFDRANRTEALNPRLLVLLDEAANTPLPKLPQWASTVTGAGIQLVTVWQSKAQLDQIHGRDAETVLTNHRTKLVYPSGLSDLATIDYLSQLVGTEHVRSDLDENRWTMSGERPPPRSPSTAVTFLAPSILRQMQTGDALLIHGGLPPAWIRAR